MKAVHIAFLALLGLLTAGVVAEKIYFDEVQSVLMNSWTLAVVVLIAVLLMRLRQRMSSRASGKSDADSEKGYDQMLRQAAIFLWVMGGTFALLGIWLVAMFIDSDDPKSGIGLVGAIGAAPFSFLCFVGGFRAFRDSYRTASARELTE